MNEKSAKQLAGEKACEWVKSGMKIGLGTGSTAYFAIQEVARMIREEGLQIAAIPTSNHTESLMQQWGIPQLDLATTASLELTIDGADEFDPNFHLIKGGGGALFREKVVASMSKEFLIIVDPRKQVEVLGKFPLPVEVVQFGWEKVYDKISAMGIKAIRREAEGKPFITDNHNFILDCYFEAIPDPAGLQQELIHIVGVVETGLFIDMATKVIIGIEPEGVEVLEK